MRIATLAFSPVRQSINISIISTFHLKPSLAADGAARPARVAWGTCLAAEARVTRGTEALLHRGEHPEAGVLALPGLQLDVRHRHVHRPGLVELGSDEDHVHVGEDGHDLVPGGGGPGLAGREVGEPVTRPEPGGYLGLLVRLETGGDVGQALSVTALLTSYIILCFI